MASAGRTSTRTSAVSDPALAKSCHTGRHDDDLAGTREQPRAAETEAHAPAHDLEALRLNRVTM